MPMTVIVTRDVEARYRGFLASVLLEVAPGVYVSPDLSAGVRERVWNVVRDWYEALGRGAIAMIWRDSSCAGGLALRYLGDPPKEICDVEGILLVRKL
ncbi:MAG: type I-E CRISPR-associated endoribonuclease Cas2e [Gammaproteobacteria bacterium]|nr:type I-E CRISPR-associated endoribonuclease Cas2e [Gammaproteobacteria bacterium]